MKPRSPKYLTIRRLQLALARRDERLARGMFKTFDPNPRTIRAGFEARERVEAAEKAVQQALRMAIRWQRLDQRAIDALQDGRIRRAVAWWRAGFGGDAKTAYRAITGHMRWLDYQNSQSA